MLMVISPAKTLDFETPAFTRHTSQPDFLEHSAELISILRQKSPAELSGLMATPVHPGKCKTGGTGLHG